MNYYIQGNKDKADQIKAAFEKLGYKTIEYCFNAERTLYFTFGDAVKTASYEPYKSIIKTHPDYQELELPIQPKFKVGDWIVNDYCTGKVIALTDDAYLLDSGQGIPFSCEHNAHLWTIEDARDGDVICTPNNNLFIYKCKGSGVQIYDYCGLYHGKFEPDSSSPNGAYNSCDGYVPATKEQRDMFFTKMREAGYQWDSEKKELRKIKPHYDIWNFNPFDKVLVRCSNDEEWMIEFYCKYDTLVHTSPHRDYPFMGIGDSYSQCIPFEGNEHLLGTTDMCDEMYINW